MSRTGIDAASGRRGKLAPGIAPTLVAFVGRVGATISLWRNRVHYRRALARMSERQLTDIGVSWSSIAAEVSKPFWRE